MNQSTEPETHIGKAGTAHGLEHCRPIWCGQFPGEGHPLAATEDEKRLLAEGANPYLVYIGAYTPRAEANQVNARLGVYGGHSDGTENLGIDRFERTQEPKLPPTSDPLARFVIARIIEAETEPRGEVIAAYDLPAGPMAHRYAKGVRRDMVVFRRIVAEYLTLQQELAEAVSPSSQRLLSGSVLTATVMLKMIACRWSDHPQFLEGWRLP